MRSRVIANYVGVNRLKPHGIRGFIGSGIFSSRSGNRWHGFAVNRILTAA
jgi:hypothetical protein